MLASDAVVAGAALGSCPPASLHTSPPSRPPSDLECPTVLPANASRPLPSPLPGYPCRVSGGWKPRASCTPQHPSGTPTPCKQVGGEQRKQHGGAVASALAAGVCCAVCPRSRSLLARSHVVAMPPLLLPPHRFSSGMMVPVPLVCWGMVTAAAMLLLLLVMKAVTERRLGRRLDLAGGGGGDAHHHPHAHHAHQLLPVSPDACHS